MVQKSITDDLLYKNNTLNHDHFNNHDNAAKIKHHNISLEKTSLYPLKPDKR